MGRNRGTNTERNTLPRDFCKPDVLPEINEDGYDLLRQRQLVLIVSTVNAQGLVAHKGVIENDKIPNYSDLMVVHKTWMDSTNTEKLNESELIASNNTTKEFRRDRRLSHSNSRRSKFLQSEFL